MSAPVNPQALAAAYEAIKRASRGSVGPSLAERVARLPAPERRAVYDRLAGIDGMRLLYAWRFWARRKQLPPPDDWDVWLILAGRGFGKSRTGAEWVRERVASGARTIAIVGPSFGDIRKYMVGGADGKEGNGSGLLDIFPPWDRPRFIEHPKQEIHFKTGARAYICSAEEPEFRGGNYDSVWVDEPIKMRLIDRLWDNILLATRKKGIRSGLEPRIVVTSTPRPIDWLKGLLIEPGTRTTHGYTVENANNVSRKWLAGIQRKLGGTRQGLQELEAELLGDLEGALWSLANIERLRVHPRDVPAIVRRVVSVDPAVSKNRRSDETGITVEGVDDAGELYVFDDATDKYSAERWADVVLDLVLLHRADAVVCERNRGGDLVAANVRAAARARGVRAPTIVEVQARGDKGERAEPIATLYERGKVHHVGRSKGLERLESEMTTWNPRMSLSPNGVDSLCHGAYELTGIGEEEEEPKVDPRGQWNALARLAVKLPAPAPRTL